MTRADRPAEPAVGAATRRIYHLVAASDLQRGLDGESFRPASLASEGFVHCADRSAVLPVANDYFAAVHETVLVLEVDPSRLQAETRYEPPAPLAGGGTTHLACAAEFPHVYGPIDLAAIEGVGSLGRSEGGFEWPATFESVAGILDQLDPGTSPRSDPRCS